ncbi:cytochrome b/b6 domain-containing protein [Pseudidiomarina sp.]|uniref:cytochrome b/b6 domain-containing protein n=1 Tax=Pseudidiomarina sp. TaxID=2081707 RepID=UPI00299D31CD|nr:cytochrome b/b6 domain-containing protein [Pseudidiomarina sp.]MDX1706119.1 cytochrome b/b6 domain-containing protein [Pseudidiomarina sp.]
MSRVKIWDSFIRIYHWLMVLLIIAQLWTASQGYMEWHQRGAFILAALIVARLIWGFIGSESARFSAFLRGPRAVIEHFRELRDGRHQKETTHNAAGGWSVLLILLALLIQIGTGLFATDDILFDGPLAYLVSDSTQDMLTTIHHLNVYFIFAIVGLHVLAIIGYRLIGIGLTMAMIHGYQTFEDERAHRKAPRLRNGIWGLLIAGVIASALYYFGA